MSRDQFAGALDDIAAGGRLLVGLPGALRHRIEPGRARAIVRGRLSRREDDFLALARRAIYAYPASPYLGLLRLAGCEYGDLERLVRGDGLEGTLRALYSRGVYLTVDELKGRRAAVRGSARLVVEPRRLRNPLLGGGQLPIMTGGSRGVRTPTPIDFGHIVDCAFSKLLVLEAQGGLWWRQALWSVPGATALLRLIEFTMIGSRPERWFSQIDPRAQRLHPRYRWSGDLLHWVSLLVARPLPTARYVPLSQPLPIVEWMTETLRGGERPSLHTFPSSAVRVSRAALETGIDLQGVHFAVGGEPITASRVSAILASGAKLSTRYGSVEAGQIAMGCLSPTSPDEMHLLGDLLAVVQPGQAREPHGLPPEALLLTSLRASAPLILVNASSGDSAEVFERACGCALERLGYGTHLRMIRSFEKLTGEGMTFYDADVVRVLEQVLPARFGGGATDFQLLEEEREDGRPRLTLLVSPTVGSVDQAAVATAFLEAIGEGAGVERVMALQWREAGLLTVERREPLVTPAGKILHVYSGRPGG